MEESIRERKIEDAGERRQIITGVHRMTEELIFDRSWDLFIRTGRKSRESRNKRRVVDLACKVPGSS